MTLLARGTGTPANFRQKERLFIRFTVSKEIAIIVCSCAGVLKFFYVFLFCR